MDKLLAQALTIPWGPDSTPQKVTDGVKGLKQSSVGEIIFSSLSYIFLFAGVGLLLMLLAGGFTFLTSAGDAKKLEQGKQRITNALIGFFIIFSSFWIVQALGIVFGFDTITTIFK